MLFSLPIYYTSLYFFTLPLYYYTTLLYFMQKNYTVLLHYTNSIVFWKRRIAN